MLLSPGKHKLDERLKFSNFDGSQICSPLSPVQPLIGGYYSRGKQHFQGNFLPLGLVTTEVGCTVAGKMYSISLESSF